MDDEFIRKTQPEGALGPPSRKPPTAVATATPNPEHRREPIVRARRPILFRFLSRTLDVVDEVGDIIASALRLRPS